MTIEDKLIKQYKDNKTYANKVIFLERLIAFGFKMNREAKELDEDIKDLFNFLTKWETGLKKYQNLLKEYLNNGLGTEIPQFTNNTKN